MCTFRIAYDEKPDGRWIAERADIPGSMAYGSTREYLKRKAQGIALHALAERMEHGEDISCLDIIAYANVV